MNEMNNEVIITCAVTGGGDTADKSPHVPVTPKQIAAAAIEAAKEGAAIVHCHVRDPETGQNAFKTELFAEVVARIRESETDVVINLTGGNGGAIFIDDNKPGEWLPESDLTTPEGRVAHAVELLPEICTLDLGLINFGANVAYLGNDSAVREMAKRMQAVGVKPELEVFDVGPIMQARMLMEEGVLDAPPMFQLCLGYRHERTNRYQGHAGHARYPARRRILVVFRYLAPSDAHGCEIGRAGRQRPCWPGGQSLSLARRARIQWPTGREGPYHHRGHGCAHPDA